MPVIKVWCVGERTQDELFDLYRGVINSTLQIRELGLQGEMEISCLFPMDGLRVGTGEQVIVEVTGLFEKPERTPEVRNDLAENIGRKVKALCPKAMVEVFVYPFNQNISGFWKAD